jgi:uncharacterized protein YeaO (DUF488 family)
VLSLKMRRVYEAQTAGDGQRVLVDRIWPRGVSKQALGDAIWLKDIAPSTDLRKWFDHRPDRWEQFRARFAAELDRNPNSVSRLLDLMRRGR